MNDTNQVSPNLHEAMEYAFALHGWDVRKASPVPLVVHLFSVCGLVLQDGGSEEEGIAALLHDALEDKPQEISADEIERHFGTTVSEIVRACTDTPAGYKGGPKPKWKERKQNYIEHVKATKPELLRASIADKIDNTRSILADHARVGEELWARFNAGKDDQLWYYGKLLEAFDCAGFRGPLLEEYRSLVKALSEL